MAALQLRPMWGKVALGPAQMTSDDLLRLPDDGATNELYEGMVIQHMTSPGHGGICVRLIGHLFIYARAAHFTNQIVDNSLFDITMPTSAQRTVLAPDIAILRHANPLPWNVPHDVPLLAVEVLSPASQTMAELATKAQLYVQAGVEEVWLIDAEQRIVEVWTAQGTMVLHDTQMLTSPLVPGFSLAIAELLG